MRYCRILRILVLTILSTPQLADSLSGEHVCTRVKNHTLTVRESYTEPVIVQTFTWCLQVPPRCPKTRIENRERYRIKTTVEEKTISECCDGYVIQELHGETETEPKCIPYCKSCENGLCLKPNVCQCEPGYQGDICAHECPRGSWGRQCMEECDCASGGSCNPVNGICDCPAGWQGNGCKQPCPIGRWGFRCEFICDCRYMACSPETGKCHAGGSEDLALPRNLTKGDLFRAVEVSGLVAETSEKNERTETTVSNIEDDPWGPGFKGFGVTRISRTTEHTEVNFVPEDRLQTISEVPEELDVVRPEFTVADFTEPRSTTSFNELTQLEEVISRTIPETGSAITPRLSEELFYKKDDNVAATVVKTVGPPHPSYVKNVQKEQVPQIPYDTTILIVVGSVVSLCLTTLAALMVFYLKSKVFESIPLSIYSNDKNDGGQEKGNTIRTLNITNTTLPPLPTFVNPVFAANPETALITFDAAELNKHYDNRTGTISIRVSGNIRDLLESHYDRPPAATCRHTIDQNTEHVYDEIPLTTPLCVRKEA